MSQSRRYIVREIYSEVLFDLAEQGGEINTVQEELAVVRQILRQEPEFAALLNSEIIKGEEKMGIVRRVFDGRLSPLTVNFLCVLARRGRMGFLAGISDRFEATGRRIPPPPAGRGHRRQGTGRGLYRKTKSRSRRGGSAAKSSCRCGRSLADRRCRPSQGRHDDRWFGQVLSGAAVRTIVENMKEKERRQAAP